MRPSIPATFMRGGTSKALMFRRADLPGDSSEWAQLFLAALGSPDPHGRQLNGMGGGLSSLSKVCVVGPASVEDADVDFTFAQVQIKRAAVDYSGNCGNMSAAVGPFALYSGQLRRPDGQTRVRIHNTNTGKLIEAGFAVADGLPVERGDLVIPGVAAGGAPLRLDFVDPGGAATGRLLPTGRCVDELSTPDGTVRASLVDAGNPCVFVRAADLGLTGLESPAVLDDDQRLLERLATIRAHGSVAMGLAPSVEAARDRSLTPFVAVVGAPGDYPTTSGELVRGADYTLSTRFVSNGQPHRAIPGTGALCLAVAAHLPGTVVSDLRHDRRRDVLVGTPAGLLPVDADVHETEAGWQAHSVTSYRTFRRLFRGDVFV